MCEEVCESVKNNRYMGEHDMSDFLGFWCVCSGIQNLFLTKSQVAPQRLIGDPPIGTSAQERLPSEDLTMTPTFVYTNSMIKQLKNHGLLDWDFVSTLSVISTLIILSEVIN